MAPSEITHRFDTAHQIFQNSLVYHLAKIGEKELTVRRYAEENFKNTLTLDTDGPATRAGFKNGTIQVGLVFSTDADLDQLGLVVLQDDMHMIAADNVVPVIRTAAATDTVKNLLNKIDAGLTTNDLFTMNGKVSLQHQDADAVAKTYLQAHSYFA